MFVSRVVATRSSLRGSPFGHKNLQPPPPRRYVIYHVHRNGRVDLSIRYEAIRGHRSSPNTVHTSAVRHPSKPNFPYHSSVTPGGRVSRSREIRPSRHVTYRTHGRGRAQRALTVEGGLFPAAFVKTTKKKICSV